MTGARWRVAAVLVTLAVVVLAVAALAAPGAPAPRAGVWTPPVARAHGRRPTGENHRRRAPAADPPRHGGLADRRGPAGAANRPAQPAGHRRLVHRRGAAAQPHPAPDRDAARRRRLLHAGLALTPDAHGWHGPPPFTLQLAGLVSNYGRPSVACVTATWDWGNGAAETVPCAPLRPANGPAITGSVGRHVYTRAGAYTVRLRLALNDGSVADAPPAPPRSRPLT